MVLVLVRHPVDPLLQDPDPVRPEDHDVLPVSGLHIAQTIVSLVLKNGLRVAATRHLPRGSKKIFPLALTA